MAKQDKKGKAGRRRRALVDQIQAVLGSPILRDVIAAGLIAAAGAISASPKAQRGAKRGLDKARDAAGEAVDEVEDEVEDAGSTLAEAAGAAAHQLLSDRKPKAKAKGPKRVRKAGNGTRATPR